MGRCKSGLSRLNLFWWYHYIQNILFKTYDSIIIGGTPVIFRKNDDLNLTRSGRSHMTSVLWLQSFLYLKPIWCSNFIKIYLDTLRFSYSMKYFCTRRTPLQTFHCHHFISFKKFLHWSFYQIFLKCIQFFLSTSCLTLQITHCFTIWVLCLNNSP